MKALTSFGEFELPRTLAQFLDLPRFQDGSSILKWAPVVDVTEDTKSYQVKAELPDVAKENIKVTTENGILTISGERKAEKEEQNKRFHRREIVYGTFTRSFSIPDDADEHNIAADYKDGILKVTLPKIEKPKPKEVEVKIA